MATSLVIGNWKMNGGSTDLVEATALAELIRQNPVCAHVALCAPATLIDRLARAAAGSGILVGGQDCHAETAGAYTGDVSAEMLADAGAQMVIVGHSERRGAHRETNAVVRAKAAAALRAGLQPVICVGETFVEHELGSALDVVRSQVAASLPATDQDAPAITIAYEPIWAIGTGLVSSITEIEEMHHAIRQTLVRRLGEGGRGVRILYGGSVSPENAGGILGAAEVGGALVGRASLKAAEFMRIIEAPQSADVTDLIYSSHCIGRV